MDKLDDVVGVVAGILICIALGLAAVEIIPWSWFWFVSAGLVSVSHLAALWSDDDTEDGTVAVPFLIALGLAAAETITWICLSLALGGALMHFLAARVLAGTEPETPQEASRRRREVWRGCDDRNVIRYMIKM